MVQKYITTMRYTAICTLSVLVLCIMPSLQQELYQSHCLLNSPDSRPCCMYRLEETMSYNCIESCTFINKKTVFQRPVEMSLFIKNSIKIIPYCSFKLKKLQNIKTFYTKYFYISFDTQLNWISAQKFCRSNGMIMDSVIDSSVLKSLNMFLTTEIKNYEGAKYWEFWSSGSNVASRSFVWTESGTNISQVLESQSYKACVFIAKNVNTSLELKVARCDEEKYFYCTLPEYCYPVEISKVMQSISPVALKQSFNKALKAASTPTPVLRNETCECHTEIPTSVTTEETYEVLRGCNSTFYYKNKQRTYYTALGNCEIEDLQLFSPQTLNDTACLVKLIPPQRVNLLSVWTSAKGCDGKFKFCATGKALKAGHRWSKGFPITNSTSNKCVVLQISTRAKFAFQNVDCYSLGYSYFCQKPEKLTIGLKSENKTEVITKPPKPRCIPKCPAYKCIVNNDYFFPNGSLNIQPKIGEVRMICGKKYIFSTARVQFHHLAATHCCQFGYSVLSLETLHEFKCIWNVFKEMKIDKRNKDFRTFHTSLCDEKCEGDFMWCATNATLSSDIPWNPKEPNNGMGGENCGSISINDQAQLGMNDIVCTSVFTSAKGVICEDSNYLYR